MRYQPAVAFDDSRYALTFQRRNEKERRARRIERERREREEQAWSDFHS